jgi:Mn2+/Fe2+ NRAMP family transporter
VRIRDLGPGLILAATGIGVGDMVASTIAGAEYGLTLAWALAAGVVVKYAITEGVARWQLATGRTMVEGWRDHLPAALVVGFFAYFVVWSYFVSSALVTASAFVPAALIPSVPLWAWGTLHAIAALVLVLVGRYEQLLTVMKVFIGMMFTALIATVLLILFRSGADWGAMASRSEFSVSYTLSLIGGIGGTVTLLSYGYWMKEAGWAGPTRLRDARIDLFVSFALAFVFALCMIFLSSQIEWAGPILETGPTLCLLLADRIGQETGAIGRGLFLVGFWGAAYSSVVGVFDGVPFLFDDWIHVWRHQTALGKRGWAYRSWAVYLTIAAISSMVLSRPVWLVFAYTLVGSAFFPFVIATLLWLNNSRHMPASARSSATVNVVLVGALLLYVYLGVEATLG